MNKIKLGIFGDSYASDQYDGSWPTILKSKFNCQIYNNFALPGTSIWYSYKLFLKSYHLYDHIVFVYSDPHRWQHLPDHLATYSWAYDSSSLKNLSNDELKDMEKIIPARKYIWDEQLDLFMYQHIFNLVNYVCKTHNIKLINIHPFELYNTSKIMIGTDTRSGTCIYGLNNVSNKEFIEYKNFKSQPVLFTEVDMRPCHMNKHNNSVVADVIEKNMIDNNCSEYDILDNNDLSFDPKEVIEFLQ